MTELLSTFNQALPQSWVQKIFATMQGHYGTRFLNMWKTGQILSDGTDAGVANAMEHWSRKLAGWSDSPETIKRTLENLPADPPSLPQFCEMMRLNYIPKNNLAISYEPSKETIAANKKRLADLLSTLNLKRIPDDMEHN
jgi:hypothetical protein